MPQTPKYLTRMQGPTQQALQDGQMDPVQDAAHIYNMAAKAVEKAKAAVASRENELLRIEKQTKMQTRREYEQGFAPMVTALRRMSGPMTMVGGKSIDTKLVNNTPPELTLWLKGGRTHPAAPLNHAPDGEKLQRIGTLTWTPGLEYYSYDDHCMLDEDWSFRNHTLAEAVPTLAYVIAQLVAGANV